LSALLVALASAAQAQTTIRVPVDYPTIQSAIDAAANGDIVLVTPGTYVENINFLGKTITVTSEGGAELTRIDGGRNGSVVTFASGEGRASVISGFTLTNGQNHDQGGGILVRNASPSIVGNIIANNLACGGPGIMATDSGLLVRNNTIINNKTSGCSGGVYGGGVTVFRGASAEIVDNLIAGNLSRGMAGGVSLWGTASPAVSGNVIQGNSCLGGGCGGGITIVSFQAVIAQNLIVGNSGSDGGGINWVLSPSQGQAGPLIVNNTIAHNIAARGSEIFAESFDATSVLHNNIIIGTRGISAVHCEDLPPSFRFNNVFTTQAAPYSGTCSDRTGIGGNISAEPAFAYSANGDYRLQLGSPGLDAGDNTAPQIRPRDADGNPRIVDGDRNASSVIDMGAYERGTSLAPAFHYFGGLAAARRLRSLIPVPLRFRSAPSV
jgi:hypothetical protein